MKRIQLERTFQAVPVRETDGDPELLLRMAASIGVGQSWGEVLRSRYVVILGEAGAGKTTEMHLQVENLEQAGEQAFYLEVVALSRHGLRRALDDPDQVDHWRASKDEEAYFFLDSVDEAKLERESIAQALRNLQHDLGQDFVRAQDQVSGHQLHGAYETAQAYTTRGESQGDAQLSYHLADAVDGWDQLTEM